MFYEKCEIFISRNTSQVNIFFQRKSAVEYKPPIKQLTGNLVLPQIPKELSGKSFLKDNRNV